MSLIQWFIVLAIFLLTFNKASKSDAFVLFRAYLIYQFAIVDLPAEAYYSCTAFMNLIVGIILHHRNVSGALCSYSLIFVNCLGFYLWYKYSPPTLYDNISLIILILQLVAITPRGLLNGIRCHLKPPVAISNGFDSIKARVTMYKNTTTKKAAK